MMVSMVREFVYTIDEDDKAQQISVVTGIGVGDRIEVDGELEDNAPVVVRGAERLRPGQKVRYKNESGTAVASLNSGT